MRVIDILEHPILQNAKLLAGEPGVERVIHHVTMMDAPDIIHFLKPNELLVTTAYHLKDNPRALAGLINQMANQQCAALGIKTKRFLDEVPAEVLALANELRFPIIELPVDISLGEIVNQTLSCILDMRTNELHSAIEAHQRFTDHIISGKGIKRLLESLSSIIHYPVLLLDQHAKPIAASHTLPDFICHIEDLYKNGHCFFLSKQIHSSFSFLNGRSVVSAFPVHTHEKERGCLMVLGNIPHSNRSVILTIEQATNVISFELMKENALKQHARRMRNEFFNNFLEGAFSSQEEIINRAKEFHLRNDQKYICIAGKLDLHEKSLSFTQYQTETDFIYKCLERELSRFSLPTHLFIKGDHCILLTEVKDPQKDVSASILPCLKLLQTKINNRFGRTISFGISNVSLQFIDVQNGFKEAIDALHTGQLSGSTQFIQPFQTKDISELLRIIPAEDLKEFYFHILQNLAQPNQTEDQSLLHTLFIYLENHCQISETAKRLYVHRNTVIYRLEKCEELLGRSLKDPDTTLQLRLALRIKTLLNL